MSNVTIQVSIHVYRNPSGQNGHDQSRWRVRQRRAMGLSSPSPVDPYRRLPSLVMAIPRHSGHVRGRSVLPPAPDVGGTPGKRLSLTRFGSSRSWPDTKAAARCPPPLVLGEVSSGNPSAHYVAENGEADGEQGERARFRDRHWRRPQQRRGHGQEMPRRSRCRGCRDRGSRNSHPILGWGHPLSAALGQGRRRQPTARRSCPRRTGR